MNILQVLLRLRDDIKTWVTKNLEALDKKVDDSTVQVDSKLSSTSTNPVQNKAITQAINNIPKFSGDYNDLTNAPSISDDASGNLTIADEAGNVIVKVDADGIHTTALSLNGEPVATEEYVDTAIATNVDFTGYATEDLVEQYIENVKTELSESIVSESNEWKIVDSEGNIIFNVDDTGAHTTGLSLNGEAAATEKYVNDAIAAADVSSQINTHNQSEIAHEDIRDSISDLSDLVGATAVSKQIEEAIAKIPATDLSNYYNKEETDNAIATAKEELSESIVAEADAWKVVDEAGNIIFSVDAEGAHTTELSLNGVKAATETYVDAAVANIEFPTTDLTDYATKNYVDTAVGSIEIPDVDFTGYATETYVNDKVADLVNSAPEALNTLGELAAALENHEDAYDALLETVGGKATKQELEEAKIELSESIVSETDEFHIVDEAGNIVASIDENGVAATTVTAQRIIVNNNNVEEHISNAEIHITTAEKDAWNSKSNFSGSYNDLTDTPVIPDLTGYATENFVTNKIAEARLEDTDVDLSGYATKDDIKNFITEVPSEYVTDVELNDKGYLTEHQSLAGFATESYVDNMKAELSESIVAEQEAFHVVDDAGNIIMSIDEKGLITTSVEAQDITVAGNSIKEHVNDESVHVTAAEKAYWNSKLDQSSGPNNTGITEETDPTVPAWAKEANKPSYTADEVGALADTTVLADLTDDTSHRTVTDAEKQVWNAKSDFSGDYNDLTNAPDISEDESGDLIIADANGNILFRSNSTGLETVNLTVETLTINGKSIQDMIREAVEEIMLGGKW